MGRRVITAREQFEMLAPWRTAARPDPHLGQGPWYHGTSNEMDIGSQLLPGDLMGTKSMGKYSDGSKVWVSNDPFRAGAYGHKLYEVEPHSQPRAPYAGHDEHHTTGATILREVPWEEAREFDRQKRQAGADKVGGDNLWWSGNEHLREAAVAPLESINPTGGLFVDYDPQSRTGPHGPGITTLDKVHGSHPDEPVTIYRGAPRHQRQINPGDFITTDPQLAKMYGENVLQMQVPKSHVATDPDEWEGGEHIYSPRTAAADYRDLYHRTSPENAAAINQSRSFNPGLEKGQRPDAIFFSTHLGEEDPDYNPTSGYGSGMVHLRVPNRLFKDEYGEFKGGAGWLDDEFPSGEQHWAIPHQHIRPEWFHQASRTAAAEEDYRGQHQAPANAEEGSPMHDVRESFGSTFYQDPPHYWEGLGTGHSFSQIHKVRDNPDAKVRIHRAVPWSQITKQKHPADEYGPAVTTHHAPINPGDWVSTSYDYAKEHGESNLHNEPWTIVRQTVPAKHLFTEGNSLDEWGYGGPEPIEGMEWPKAEGQRKYRQRKMRQPQITEASTHMAVTVYTKPGCPQCDMTRKRLDAHGIPHEAVDLTQDPEAYHHVTQNLGYREAPVVVAGDDHWSGFRPDRIKDLVT